MKCPCRMHSMFLSDGIGRQALQSGAGKRAIGWIRKGRADNDGAATELADKTDTVWALRANLKKSYRTSLQSIDDHAENAAEMQRGLRLIAGQYRNQTVFQLDAVGQLFTQNGQIFTQRRHNFAVVFAIILIVEIEYRLRDLEHARINLFCHANHRHAAFAIFGKMTVELKVGLRSVIDQGLAKALQGHGYRRIADEGTLFYQVTVECQHVGACIYQLADQIG